MVKRETLAQIGEYAFIVGIVLSYVAIFFRDKFSTSLILFILFVLGLIVGWLNVNRANTTDFLIGVMTWVVLALAGFNISSGLQLNVAEYADEVFRNLLVFIGAAALVVSRKVIFGAVKRPEV